jgi:hypothetical protein
MVMLEQNHGRPCLKATLQDLATHVGTVVQAKEESWCYATPELSKVATEAECKTLVKQRLGCSGMRWTPEGAQIILSLRALVLTGNQVGTVLAKDQPVWRS